MKAKKENLEIPDALLVNHGKQIVKGIIRDIPRLAASDPDYGCLTRGCRTTPTSTRLEGLISFYGVLGPEDDGLTKSIAEVSRNGIEFVIRSQIKKGPYAGAIPPVLIEDVNQLRKSSRKNNFCLRKK